MAESLKGRKVAFLATDGVEQVELTEPWNVLRNAQADLTLVSDKEGEIQGVNHGEKADKFRVDKLVDQVTARDFDALVLPGGVRSPDKLRTNPRAVEFVRGFMESDKPVAAICHGPWLLVEADLLRDRAATGWPSIRTDLRNAGARVVDEPAVVDGNIVTSRNPDDVEEFTRAVIDLVEKASEGVKARRPSELPA